MASKIFSILTILIAIGAAYLGMEGKKAVDALQGDLADKKTKLANEISAHNKTKDTLKKTQEELEATKADLEATKGKLRETEDALAKTKTELSNEQAAHAMAKTELEGIKKQITEALGGGDLTTGIAGLKDKITEMTTKIKDQETKIGELEKEVASNKATIATNIADIKSKEEKIAADTVKINRWEKNIMEKGTRGRVMAVNPGWGFAVLNIGDKQGAAANKLMVVSRGGQAIGRVKITSVETNQSIADIVPGTFVKGATLEPGDSVIFTGEDKVKTEAADAGTTVPVPAPELPTNP